MRIVQLFATEGFQKKTFAEINHENYVAAMKQIRIFAVFHAVMISSCPLPWLFLHLARGGKVINEQLSSGLLWLFSVTFRCSSPIRILPRNTTSCSRPWLPRSALWSSLTIKRRSLNLSIRDPEPVLGHLRFDGVTSVTAKEVPVLKDVVLRVKPERWWRLSGPRSRENHVVNLIERFYDPLEGVFCSTAWTCGSGQEGSAAAHRSGDAGCVYLFRKPCGQYSAGDHHEGTEVLDRAIAQANAALVHSEIARKAWSRILERRARTYPQENASSSPLHEPWPMTESADSRRGHIECRSGDGTSDPGSGFYHDAKRDDPGDRSSPFYDSAGGPDPCHAATARSGNRGPTKNLWPQRGVLQTQQVSEV